MGRAKLFHSRIVSSNNLIQIAMADLLEKLSLKHCNLANVNDPGIALSNILVTHCNTAILRRDLNIKHFEKEKIYQPYPNQNNFLPNLKINSMDIPLLYKLITCISVFPTYLRNQQNLCQRAATKISCCGQCSHLCNLCNKEDCLPNCQNKISNVWDHRCQTCGETKSQCIEAKCNACVNNNNDIQCGIFNLTVGVGTSKENRNTSFHLTLSECRMFIKQKASLNGFPNCHKEEDLFNLIRKSFTSILNFLCNVDYFQKDPLSFKNRRQRIKEMNTLLFANEGEIFKDVAKNLSRQCLFLTEHIQRLQSEVSILRDEEDFNEVRLSLLTYSLNDCQLMLKGIKVTGISKVKIRQHSHGKIQSVDPNDYNCKHDDVENVSVINIFHQIEEGSKYDYEVIIDDEQKTKWKANVYQLDPCDNNLLKIETLNGSKIYVSPDASIVSKYQMRLEEKKACAITASFTSVGIKEIKIAECKERKANEWHTSANLKIVHSKDGVYYLNGTMLPHGIFDFRVLVETTAGKYRLYELENITVLEQKGFRHASSCQKTLLLSHPVGDKEDASETLKILSTHGEVGQNGVQVTIHLPGGDEATNDIDAIDYIEQNFLNRKICFPPFYMMSANSPHVRISKLFYGYFQALERKRFVILPKVDIMENLKILGFTDDQITQLFASEFGEKWQSPLVTIVFDIDSRTVLLITLSHISESLQEAHIRSDKIVKAFLTISENLIGQDPIAVVGVVACFQSNREMTINFCKDCSKHVLTKEEMETQDKFRNWFDHLSNNVGRKLQSHLGQPLEESSLESPLLRIANRLMILTSITDCSLPMVTVGSDEEKINKLLLTPEQVDAVYDDQYKKKVIKGNYGSGKSIVIKKKLQILNSVEPKEDVIYYINWDPYSLINVEIWKSTMEVEKGNKQSTKPLKQDRIVCKNVCQLSEEARSHTVFSLSQCLQNISDAHPSQTAHVLIDEYDEEELTKEEETSISRILQASATFKDAYILVSVQSVAKERKSYLFKSSEPSVYEKGCWESCAFNINMLPHTMRFTNNINDVVDNFQRAVAKQPNIYLATASQKSVLEKDNRTVLYENEIRLASGIVSSAENLPSTGRHNNSSTETLATQQQTDLKLRPEQNIDTLAKQSGIKQGYAGDNSRLETIFKFMTCVSGHKIKGSVPRLIRVDISHGINVDLMKCFINTCFFDHKKALIICNDLALMRALVEVFQTIDNICIVEYFHNLLEDLPPSFETQKFAYEELISEEERNLVLLTDSRGCRGLEYKNVICIIDEREDFERHFVIESLCRATSKLHLISFQGVSQETDTRQIVNVLTANNYVKDVTVNCMKRCSKESNYIKIDDRSYQHKQHQLNERIQKFLVFSELTEEDKQKNWTFKDIDALIGNKKYKEVLHLISIQPSVLRFYGYIADNQNLLHSASTHGSDVDFVQHLINAGCGLKEMNSHGNMPIHIAASHNHPDIVKVMWEKDHSLINERDDVFKLTSLHWAARRNHKDVVELLLSFPTIEVNMKDNIGKMADEYKTTNDEIKRMIRKHRKNNSL